MEVTIQIPDDIAASIQTAGRDLPRSVLEAYALEGYVRAAFGLPGTEGSWLRDANGRGWIS